MQQKIMKSAALLAACMLALAVGWLAHAAPPLAAQAARVADQPVVSGAALAAAPAGTKARLAYQGRLTNSSGAPVNTTVSVTFRIYTSTATAVIWTSAPRSITPVGGLFTVYLGDGADPDLAALTLSQAAFIGVTVGGDSEMTPRQPLNSVVGHSDANTGVFGNSRTGAGVVGYSDSGTGVVGDGRNDGTGVSGQAVNGTGVYGHSTTGAGVVGKSDTDSTPGIQAQAASGTGVAIEIYTGTLKVTGAGIGTPTTVFIQQVTSGGNICASKNYATVVNNPLTNGKPNAILLVTPNYGTVSGGTAPAVGTYGVFYDDSNTCGFGNDRWVIYLINGAPPALTLGSRINVMVIVP